MSFNLTFVLHLILYFQVNKPQQINEIDMTLIVAFLLMGLCMHYEDSLSILFIRAFKT